jgi:hypothetical protein
MQYDKSLKSKSSRYFPMNLVPMWSLSMKCFPQELQFSQCLKVAVKIPRIPMNLQKTWSYVNDPNLYCYNFQGICPILQSWKYRLLLLLRLLSYCILLFYILTLLSTIFQSYCGSQFFLWRKTGVPEENHWPVAGHRQTL